MNAMNNTPADADPAYLGHAHAATSPLKQRLCTKWSTLAAQPDSTAFRYKLSIRDEKTLDGKFKFFVQLNNDRTAKRRAPQIISTVTPAFDASAFNFNNVPAVEVLLPDVAIVTDGDDDVDDKTAAKTTNVSFLVNNSPMTPHHMLVCPERAANQPQVLTASAVAVAVRLLRTFADRSYRLCYNSPGAWASVNHLHLHVLHVPARLYVENVPLQRIDGSNDDDHHASTTTTTTTPVLYRIDGQFGPVDGLAFRVMPSDAPCAVGERVMRLVRGLCERQIPHNVFFTMAEHRADDDDTNPAAIIRIFVFPKEHHSQAKEFSTMNMASCELSGYVTIGNADHYAIVSEEMIVARMRAEVGGACERIVGELAKLGF